MSEGAVVRNYAEVLLELGARDGELEAYGELLGEVAALYRGEEDFRLFLDTPGVPLEEKQEALRRTFEGRAPETFLRFLMVVLEKGRHRLLPRMHERYRELVDEREGRVHAVVTLSEEPDEELESQLADGLSRSLDREVVPHFRVDEAILGGVRIRVEDRILDGSLRRRLADLRGQLLRGDGRAAAPESGSA